MPIRISFDRFFSRHTNQYCAIQNVLRKMYSSLQDLVVKKEFKVHIQKDAYKIDNVEETINECNIDVMKTECPIVIAGNKSLYKLLKAAGK